MELDRSRTGRRNLLLASLPAKDFALLAPHLKGIVLEQGAVLAWGSFLTIVINFIIIAWVLFLVVKLMNQMMQSEAPKAPALTKQETLLTEIRDLLKREQR